jgi:MtrB/PioB family decaheme-associated outer membrane protein
MMMNSRTHSPLAVLAALGALGWLTAVPFSAGAVDTSAWQCEKCPYPTGTSGTVDVGVGAVSEDSAKFGDYTGLEKKGAHLVLGGSVNARGGSGYYADLRADDLGIDSRSIDARSGREGLYSLRLGYRQIPRHVADDAVTPYAGVGSGVLTLPSGATLQPVDLGLSYKRYDLAGTLLTGDRWTWRVSLRRDTRDGTHGLASSFLTTAVQMPAPVDQSTDQFEVSGAYSRGRVQAALSYQLSQFRNGTDALVWDNPFLPVVAGATQGRLALAPDNKFEQISGSIGYDIMPRLRASADFALGRMTQDASFVPSTSNTALAPSVAPLPAAALDGKVETFSGNVRVSYAPLDVLRLNAVYSRDVRDNRTEVLSFPQVTTDITTGTPRSNTPFSFWRDRFKVNASWRGPQTLRVSGGIDFENYERNYAEVVTTRETTLWARAGIRPRDDLALALKLAHAERDNTTYGTAVWFGAPESPLLRKYNLADRTRDTVGARADVQLGDNLSLGLSADYANDDYKDSLVGLTGARSTSFGADMSFAASEETQLHAYAQAEELRSEQGGSQGGLSVDWRAEVKDRFEVLGVGVKHAAIPDKLDIGADLTVSRGRSNVRVDASVNDPAFPALRTSVDSLKLFANYRLNERAMLMGSYWYENYDAEDWRLEGVLPTTVVNLLAFGQQPQHYRQHVLRVALRYRF